MAKEIKGWFDYDRRTRVKIYSALEEYSPHRVVYWEFDLDDPHLSKFQRFWNKYIGCNLWKLTKAVDGKVYPQVIYLDSTPQGKEEFLKLKDQIKTYDDVLKLRNADYQGIWT